MLLVNGVTLHGDITELAKEPPSLVIEVYDDDALVRTKTVVIWVWVCVGGCVCSFWVYEVHFCTM